MRYPSHLLACTLLCVAIATEATELKLVTYNIRLDLASDGPNRWDARKQALAEQVANLAPDILGIQEGLSHQIEYLEAELEGYTYVGVGRDDGKRAGEFSAIFFQPAATALIATDTFWLSETPDAPSYGWGAHYRRVCTYGHFRDRASGATYWVFNTHFDHEVPAARLEGAKLILSRIEQLVAKNEACFLMGDLNATPDSPPIALISQSLADSREQTLAPPLGNVGTFNGFDPNSPADRRIDYIFAKPGISVIAYATHRDLVEQRFLSDHFPVSMNAQLPLYLPDQLLVSKNGRHLVDQDGQPFFWLADTAWELFHRLDLQESERYLDKRASQGFNVVQAVVLAEQSGLTEPNANGDLPLHELDPAQPNEDYFQHVDAVVAAANQRGIVVGLLPTWGDKFNKRWGIGPEVFNPENAAAYGRFLSKRYANASVVWILGGDRQPEEPEDYEIIHAMAQGIRAEEGGRHLITYHPSGTSRSSEFFHDAPWLDFNMFQSGHSAFDNPNFQYVKADLSLSPPKPTLDGEPCYEHIHVSFKTTNPRFDAFQSRRAGYWSVLAGALGHTYGHNSVWQMWSEKRQPILSASIPWEDALFHPGAYQAGIMRKAFESTAWQTLREASELLKTPNNATERHISVAATDSRDLIVAYVPYGQAFDIEPSALAKITSAHWLSPRNGESKPFAPPIGANFDPPGEETRANDWLLILKANKSPGR